MLEYDGAPLGAGARAAYRLVISDAAGRHAGDPVWLVGPARTALALWPLGNPAHGAIAVRLSLPGSAPAHVRLLDVGGRLVREASVPAGTQAWSFGVPPAPGLYFAEVEQAGARRVARIVAAP